MFQERAGNAAGPRLLTRIYGQIHGRIILRPDNIWMMSRAVRLLVPHVAVAVFWCWLRSGWGAILVYHGLILLLSRSNIAEIRCRITRNLLYTVPFVCTGVLAFYLLPLMLQADLASWLAGYGLTGWKWLFMIPYFGLMHPVLEQLHWVDLRRAESLGWIAHLAFASYHILVLCTLLSWPWLFLCFAVLFGASFVWAAMESRMEDGFILATLTHILADSGIVLAAMLRIRG